MTRLTVVGDALLDRDLDGRAERLAPDAPVPVVDAIEARPRAGGAGLAATLAARAGFDVTLVCALGRDTAGRGAARPCSRDAGVSVIDLGLDGRDAGEGPRARRRAADRAPRPRRRSARLRPAAAAGALDGADAVLVSDYGRGVAAEPTVRAALERAARAARLGPAPARPGARSAARRS